MDFAAAHVSERAAIPRRVKIMPSLPVTGIGKIFKPALQQREIESTIRDEAANAGASIHELWFERDPRLGQVARVRAGAGAAPLKAALERYAFKSEVLN
jgi:fatty-acyl-CoA synthase